VDDPIPDLRRICAHCGLNMSNYMVEAAKKIVKSDRKLKWNRFDQRDLAMVLPEIGGEMQRHGYEIPTDIAQCIENVHSKNEVGLCPT
jgi:hypothetical protein